MSDVKQEGQDTAKAADVNDLRHSLAELQEAWVSGTICSILNVLGRPHVDLANPCEPKVFREAEQKTAAEARSNLDHVRFRVQELSEA